MTDDGVRLTRKHTRLPWVPDKVALHQLADPLRFRGITESWPAGTKAKADDLDDLAIPTEWGRGKVVQRLRDLGVDLGRSEVLAAGIRYRRSGDKCGNRSDR